MAFPVEISDLQDIEASLDGSESAFARLVHRYQDKIAGQMWRFTRDRNEVEELVQEVFVEAYFSLKTFKGRSPFLHWLRKIASRTGYRYWKKQARERRNREALQEMPVLDPDRPDPEDAAEAADTIQGLLGRLEPKDRMILTLQYLEELNTREIAERMGWSLSLVKVRAFRARKRLKALLDEAGYEV